MGSLKVRKLSFDILEIEYVAKKKSRDYITVRVDTSDMDSSYLDDTETFNIGKTKRFVKKDEINREKLVNKVESLLEDRKRINKHRESDEETKYVQDSADAGADMAEKIDGLTVKKKE